jgi:hypothetical protein
VANIYGIANNPTPGLSYGTIGAIDVTLTSSTEVNFISSGVLAANFEGDYWPLIIGCLTVVLGGAAPSAFKIAYRLGSGSDVASFTVEPGLLVNSAELVIPFCFAGPSSGSAWFPTGSTINITGKGTGQASTAKAVGSYAVVLLLPGSNS